MNDHKTPMKLKVHSHNKVTDYETQFGEWEIQLTMQISFVSSKHFEETRTIHTKSDNIEIIMGSETDDIINILFYSPLQRYPEGLEEKMRGKGFIFDSVELLHHHLQKTSLKKGRSYINSTMWLRNKKATINPKNNVDICYQYAITVALDYDKIKNHLERISNLNLSLINITGMEKIFHHQKDWKKFEQNHKIIALNILYVPHNTWEIRVAYKSKYNFKRDNRVIFLMITDSKKWHYFAVENLCRLLRRITSNHNEDFYFLSCCSYCYVEMPDEKNKTLEYNPGEKSLKAPFSIPTDIESLIPKLPSFQNNPKIFYIDKKAKHIAPGSLVV